MDQSLRLYEQSAGIVKEGREDVPQAARNYHARIAKKVAKNMTQAQRTARASAGGYARWATKFGISAEDYLKAKIAADKQGITVAEYLKERGE